ncbi:MAG: aminodeoxychorismate synthase component I [Deltaproteobacteria bacterium]|nr:aminodeoxychorismate synthase component I [Deltaproteobacteria bacterium]TLN03641.1 MAG: aminodeoxychorismate synthase component I [bacterium]
MNHNPEIILGSFACQETGIYRFEGLVTEIVATEETEVVPALKMIERAVQSGYYAVGFVSYEAAVALDHSLTVKLPTGFPLLWFGIYRERCLHLPRNLPEFSPQNFYELSAWQPAISRDEYRYALAKIKDYIGAGDCYQVNYTFQQRSTFTGDVRSFYYDLCRAQSTSYAAFFDLGRFSILSTSPELFFRLDKGVVTVRPMKGTAGRGKSTDEDERISQSLQRNEKERAENLMIVDLLRNDLGRISENGSVTVNSLFDVETLATIHQMTSTVSSRLRVDVGLVDIFRALFPCGSITGAPKKRSMEIIAELENTPRGLYTGCIGYLAPEMREAVFSVAIRTIVLDKDAGTGALGVGSGITWYSEPDAEFEECLSKGLFAQNSRPVFTLIESLLFSADSGYFLIDRHLKRLADSARYFGFAIDICAARTRLEKSAEAISGRAKVRLILSSDGSLAVEVEPLVCSTSDEISWITFADVRVDSSHQFLYHKTSNRELYHRELGKKPGCVDVIFLNERNEVTEGANNNIVVRKNGLLVTPPVTCGLLPGTFRAQLLESGEITEQILVPADLEQAEEIYLVNSVRKWRRVRLVTGELK